MAVRFQDYYETLGVSRSATESEIKSAFRRLARKYHPDVAKDKRTAEEKFKALNEAYEVLSDPDKRRKYDQLGADWKPGAPPPPASGFPPGGFAPGGTGGPFADFEVDGTGFSDFFEQYFGGSEGVRGAAGFGRGRAFRSRPGGARRGADVESDLLVTLHEALHGAVRQLALRRVDPRTGAEQTDTFRVRIPTGATEGRLIRVPGKGEPGAGGGGSGDLFLRVRLARHPDFRVQGTDLYHDLPLAPWEAVLGATVTVPTIEGTVDVKIPPLSQRGQQLRLRGRGLPAEGSGRGDLLVVLSVVTPEAVTAEERRAWEQLAERSHFHPRRSA
jgi:curved DNA-binding protein